MSLVVLGMEMPVSGTKYRVVEDLEGNKYLTPDGFFSEEYYTIRPLPEEHGRLVDVDDMERFMSDIVQGDIRQYPYSDTLWDTAFKWIDSRPTIIEAEEC